MKKNPSLDILESDLANKPLDLSAWVEYFFTSLIDSKLDTAREVFTKLIPFLAESETSKLFNDCLKQEGMLFEQDGFYWISNDLESSWREKIAGVAKRVASIFEFDKPVILFVYHQDVHSPPYAVSLFAGAGVVYLPPMNCAANVIAHEVAHCIMTSGHNFLDESLAYWIEAQFNSKPNRQDQSYLPISQCLNLPDIEQLNGFSENEILSIYRQGSEFINDLIDQLGVDKLKYIYHHIPLWVACECLQEELQIFYDIAAHDLNQEQARDQFAHATAAEIILDIENSFFAGRLDNLEKLYTLSCAKTFPQALQNEALVNKTRALFAMCFFEVNIRAPFHISSIKTLFDTYQCSTGIDKNIDGIIILVYHKMLLLKYAGSYMDIRQYDGQINRLVLQGLSLDSQNAELNLLAAIKQRITPVQYGGDHVAAHQHFSIARQDDEKGELIEQFIKRHFDTLEA